MGCGTCSSVHYRPVQNTPPPYTIWMSLNGLRVGVSRCKQNLARWGYTQDAKCECGATQDEQHLLNYEQLENTCTHHDIKEANQRAVQVANFWKFEIQKWFRKVSKDSSI
ncbi:hypothetical protein M8J77_023096 [Diaphorina citri]|nr:hypothetical protein M8J77_023096 [Diaphorina citri]